jgi:hypothetical protein
VTDWGAELENALNAVKSDSKRNNLRPANSTANTKPCSKIPFASEQDAATALRSAQARRAVKPRAALVKRIYLCACGYWHLTKKRSWRA